MNTFDKYVIASLKLVKTQIITLVVCYIATVISAGLILNTDILFAGGISVIMMIMSIVVLVQQVLVYKKICYDSLYGSDAVLYNQFPVNGEETVAGKILAMAIVFLLEIPFLLIPMMFLGDSYEMESFLMTVPLADTGAGMLLSTISWIISGIAGEALILYAVIYYNTPWKESSKRTRLIFSVILVLVGMQLTGNLPEILEKFLENSLLASAVQSVLSLAVLVAAFQAAVKRLKNSYQI